MTALFAESGIAHYDGFTVIPGGWMDHHYIQLAWHIADSAAGLSYSFVMTVRKKRIQFLFQKKKSLYTGKRKGKVVVAPFPCYP